MDIGDLEEGVVVDVWNNDSVQTAYGQHAQIVTKELISSIATPSVFVGLVGDFAMGGMARKRIDALGTILFLNRNSIMNVHTRATYSWDMCDKPYLSVNGQPVYIFQ